MSKKRLFYYPAVAYTALLVCVWLLSWGVGVASLLRNGGDALPTLAGAEGVRWAVRSALPSVDSLPWGAIVVFVISVGLFVGSGMVRSARAVARGQAGSFVEKRAWISAAITLFLYLLLLFACTVYPWNLLLGVTGDYTTAPVWQGRVILCFTGVFFVTAVYGFIYGNYRSLLDIACSVGNAFAFFAPAFVALLPAAGVIYSAGYAGFFDMFGITTPATAAFAYILYFFPFFYVLFLGYREWDK